MSKKKEKQVSIEDSASNRSKEEFQFLNIHEDFANNMFNQDYSQNNNIIDFTETNDLHHMEVDVNPNIV